MGTRRRASSPVRLGVFRWGLILLMIAACQRSDPVRDLVVYDVTVELAGLKAKDGACGNITTGGWGDMFRATQADEEKEASFLMRIWPGAVMLVTPDGLSPVKGEPNLAIEYRGDEAEPLRFSVNGPVVLLNQQPVALAFGSPEDRQWLRERSDLDLTSIRTVRLDGDGAGDAELLSRFAGREVFVHLGEDYTGLEREDLRDALVAVRPRGLVAWLNEDQYPLLARLDRLEFLMLTGPAIPPAESLPNVRILLFVAKRRTKSLEPSLGELAKMDRLESLLLSQRKDNISFDPERLRGLKHLNSLLVVGLDEMTDLSPVAHLTDLRFLSLAGTKKLTDISQVRQLPRLIEFVLTEVPDELKDLTPIAELPELRTLVVGKDALSDRKEEIALLQKKNPDLEVFGFCLGSAWILAIVPFGLLGAAILRRRRGRAA